MIGNPLTEKVAVPYAHALFDFSVEKNIMHQITADFQNLDIFFNENKELLTYLNNPIINKKAKSEVLTKILKTQINSETFKFLMVLVDRDRINILRAITNSYLKLVYEAASIKIIKVSAAVELTESQREALIKKLKELTNAREIRLIITIDPSLIGGFLIQTESKVIDFSVKNQLQQLAKHLDAVLEIKL